MNSLAKDLDEFIYHRLNCAELHTQRSQNEYADSLEKTLSREQTVLFTRALDFENNAGSILEENAYKQGLIDGVRLFLALQFEG